MFRWLAPHRAADPPPRAPRRRSRRCPARARRTRPQPPPARATFAALATDGSRRGTPAPASVGPRVGVLRPLTSLGEPRAAVEGALVAAEACATPRAADAQAPVDPQALAVLLDPVAQARPLAQQRLVRDSTVPALTVSRRRSASSSITPRDVAAALGLELRRAARRRRSTAALGLYLGEPQEHAAGEGLLRRGRAGRRRPRRAARPLRAPRRCARRRRGAAAARRAAARARAARWRAAAARRARPRRRPRAPSTSSGSTCRPTRSRRALDRAPQLVAPHRADEHVVRGEQPRQLGVRRAAPVVVRADREHDDAAIVPSRATRTSSAMNAARSASSRQAVKVSSNWSTASTTRRSAVDVGDRAAAARAAGARPADEHLRPVLAAGQHAARQGGQQAGPDDRGLAAARRSDDAEQRRADQPRDELGDEPLAAEEVRRVGDLEGGEALERAHHRLARRRRPARRARRPPAARRRRRPARPPSSAARRGRPRPARRPRRPGARPRAAPTGSRARGRAGGRRRSPRAATRPGTSSPSGSGA